MQIVTRMVKGSPLDCDSNKSEHRHLHRLMAEHDSLCYFCEEECILICGDASSVAMNFKRQATREHLLASARGGKTTKDNIVLACRQCNNIVGDKTVAEKSRYIIFKDLK